MTKATKTPSYHQAVAYWESLAQEPLAADYLRRSAHDPNIYLQRTRYLLKILGNPDRGFKYIHITGTAGKGSVVAFLHAILSQAGYRVGSFTSPFATTSIEKIKKNDLFISPREFVRFTERLKRAVSKMRQRSPFGRPSYFECFFAIALLYFQKMRCQWVILEVGCGGTYDATNVIRRSKISACTTIGLDHTDLLGKTVAAISRDKAGIIKPRSHFFTTEKRPHLLKIFKNKCREKKTIFHRVDGSVILGFKTQTNATLKLKMIGLHQQTNAAMALAIARHLKIPVPVAKQAVYNVTLPCRFEIIQKEPLVILDGAHNPTKIKSVMHNLKHLTYNKLYIIFASAANKDALTMLRQLATVSHEIILTKFNEPSRTAFTPAQLVRLAPTNSKKIIIPNPQRALEIALQKLKKDDALLITGSFYLAGKLREYWVKEEKILLTRTTN